MSNTYTYQTSGGYTCPICSQWVTYGNYHACPGATTYSTYVSDQTVALAIGRIEALLEQILKRLDKEQS